MTKLYVDMSRKYGAWTPIEDVSELRSGRWQRFIRCQCDCGYQKLIIPRDLLKDRTPRCFQCKFNRPNKRRKSPEYWSWMAMRNRCQNPKNNAYPNYGGRGIQVCDRWNSFENFLEDMGPKPTPEHTIERENVNGHYEPQNCRWATRLEQGQNTRRTHVITYQGQTKRIGEWAKELGVSRSCLEERLKTKSIDEVLSPTNYRKNLIEYQGKTQSIEDWATEVGMAPDTLSHRLQYGWSMKDALTKPVGAKVLTYKGRSLTVPEWSKETGIAKATINFRLRSGWSVEDALTTPVNYTRKTG